MFKCVTCRPDPHRPLAPRNPRYPIGDINNKHILDNVLWLLGELIGGGLRAEGISWFKHEHSRHLCYIANLDPDALAREYQRTKIFGKWSPIAGRGKH